MESIQNRRAIAVERVVWWSVQVSLMGGIVYMYTQGNSTKMFMGALTVVVMIVFALVQRHFGYPPASNFCEHRLFFHFFLCCHRNVWWWL